MSDENVVNQETGSEPGETQATVAELERRLAQKDEELAQAGIRLSEMEKKVAESSQMLAQAVSTYRAAIVQANPLVPAELITGDTVTGINASLEQATALVKKVRQGGVVERFPAGAPERRAISLEGLSPREKIQQAIGGKR